MSTVDGTTVLGDGPVGRRAERKARTRRTIQQQALHLFLTRGYDRTTVEEIAAAAGVSHMTFFRHFPCKEAVVDTDDYDPMLGELIRRRPPGECPLTAVHRAVSQGLAMVLPADRDAVLARTRLILRTPALRARQWRNLDAVTDTIASALAQRDADDDGDGDGDGDVTLEVRALAAAAVAVLGTAITEWADRGGADDLATLVDTAFHGLVRLSRPASPG